MDVDIEQIKKLVKLVEKHHLEELTVEEDGLSVTIKGANASPAPAHIAVAHTPAHEIVVQAASAEYHLEEIEETVEEVEEDGNLHHITASMVGVFYRTPSPDDPPYIEVGDTIEVGQTIGLIEAMKVFSEIPAEVAGEIVEIPTPSGKLVQQGDTLVVVRVKE